MNDLSLNCLAELLRESKYLERFHLYWYKLNKKIFFYFLTVPQLQSQIKEWRICVGR